MGPKKALITGITGQDGSYLAEFLLNKNYEVYGLVRRSSSSNTSRINHLLNKITVYYGDLTDTSNIFNVISKIVPDEIYNLGAQSHVSVSFDQPIYTANSDALGALRILEAIRILKEEKEIRYYQASTSELYGKVQESPQKEGTQFYPKSPYGVAKLFAYWITKNYRESYGLFACNGILFNHESPRRGETFVTKKITKGLARIELGLQDSIILGNINSLRDWGHAKDYVEMQWLMLQQDIADDFVIATGKQYSIREFIEIATEKIGWGGIKWEGEGLNEVGKRLDNGNVIIRIDEKYFRASEVDSLIGDAKKANIRLGWKPKINLESLIEEMINEDLIEARTEENIKKR